MMLKVKILLKNEKIKLPFIASIISLVMLLVNNRSGVLINLSDFFCIVGLILILIGCVRYISNVGLFKTFSYYSYKRHWNKQRGQASTLRPMSLAEYTQAVILDEKRQRAVAWVMLTGVLVCALSFIIVFLKN